MADIFYTDATLVDDVPYTMRPAAEPARAHRRLPTWQIVSVYAMIHTGAMTAVVTLATGDNTLGLLSLAIHGAALLIAVVMYKLVTLVTSLL